MGRRRKQNTYSKIKGIFSFEKEEKKQCAAYSYENKQRHGECIFAENSIYPYRSMPHTHTFRIWSKSIPEWATFFSSLFEVSSIRFIANAYLLTIVTSQLTNMHFTNPCWFIDNNATTYDFFFENLSRSNSEFLKIVFSAVSKIKCLRSVRAFYSYLLWCYVHVSSHVVFSSDDVRVI